VNVLIGFDNSEASSYILADLKSAGLPADSRIQLVSATDMGSLTSDVETGIARMSQPGAEQEWHTEISEEERDYLRTMLQNAKKYAAEKEQQLQTEAREAADKLRADFPSARIEFSVSHLGPFKAISEEANRINADLIVVGSQSASTLTRFFLGSVSQKVINQSDVSVRIARAHAARSGKSLRIIVGVDGSQDSNTTIEALTRRSWPEQTIVRAVAVAEEKSYGHFLSNLAHFNWGHKPAASGAEDMPRTLALTLAETAAAKLREAGIAAEPHALHGDPKRELMEMAENWNADAIFIGGHGNTAQEGQPLGAVASALASRASCSVEIVRK